MRLRVNFRAQESEIPDTEPFTLEGLTRYQINQQLLNTWLSRKMLSVFSADSAPQGAALWCFW